MAKKTGGKSNHVSGALVSGSHTTIIDGVGKVLNKLAGKPWFVSVRPGQITTGKKVGGGTPFISVSLYNNSLHKNTLMLTCKRSGVIQKIYIQINDIENLATIIADMEQVVEKSWSGAKLINRI